MTWADLGLDPTPLSPAVRSRIERLLPLMVPCEPGEILFSQRSVSSRTKDGQTLRELQDSLRTVGWRGEPMEVVRVSATHLVALDNRRLRAARLAGLRQVPCVVHEVTEPLSSADWPARRREQARLEADIRVLPSGEWAVGGDRGMVLHPAGSVPRTYGEAVLFRAAGQRSLLPEQLFGTAALPVVLDRPAWRGVSGPDPERSFLVVSDKVARWVDSEAQPAVLAAVGGAALGGDRAHGIELVRPARPPGLAEGVILADYFGDDPVGREGGAVHSDRSLAATVHLSIADTDRYATSLAECLGELDREGLHLLGLENRWRPGNRGFGVICSLRSDKGLPIRVEFHTPQSWRLEETIREARAIEVGSGEVPVRRVHAVLRTARAAQHVDVPFPDRPADWPPPIDTGVSAWVAANGEVWSAYLDWLERNGLGLDEVLAEFGLDRSTIEDTHAHPTARRYDDDDQVLRPAQGRSAGTAERSDGDRSDDRGCDPVEQREPGLALRPSIGGGDPGRSAVSEPVLGSRSGVGGAGGAPADRRRVAGRGDDPVDLPAPRGAGHVGLSARSVSPWAGPDQATPIIASRPAPGTAPRVRRDGGPDRGVR
jgi:hypothetical protein